LHEERRHANRALSNVTRDLQFGPAGAIARAVKRATTISLGAAALLAGTAWFGCTKTDATNEPQDAGAPDATSDTVQTVDSALPDTAPPDTGAPPVDAGPDTAEEPIDASGILCGQAICAPGEPCCVTTTDAGPVLNCGSGKCAAGLFTVACDDPFDCGDAGTYCCATLATGPGPANACPPTAIYASCSNTCDVSIATQCAAVSMVRLCHAAADCASDPTYSHCCEFAYGADTASFCADDLLSAFSTHCWP
jgi:hypothetical protein